MTIYLPTNNVDSKSANGLGALDNSGTLHTSGEQVYLPFTVQGGDPAIGQTVWMAASNADGVTGRGKATATIPTTAVPPRNTGFPYYCQQVTPIGICTGGEDIPGSRYFRVQLGTTPFAPVPNTTPSNTSQTFRGVQCVNGSQNVAPYFETPATAQTNINDGESLFATFTVDNIQNAALYPGKTTGFECDTAGHAPGWQFDSATTGTRGAFYNDSGPVVGFDFQPGINRIGIVNTGGLFRVSINGSIAQTVTSAGAISIIGTLRIYWSIGAFTAMVKLARTFDDTALRANTSLLDLNYAPGSNPWAPLAALIADSTCQWYLDLTSYTSGPIVSQAGPAGTGFTWTVVGSPTARSWTINWNMSPLSLFQSCRTPVYDQKHAVKTDSNAEIIFTGVMSQAEIANITMAFISEDNDNNDEGAGAIFVNGRPALTYGPGTPDGNLLWDYPLGHIGAGFALGWWYSTFTPSGSYGGPELSAIAPPYTVRISVQDSLPRQDTMNQAASITAIGIPSTLVADTSATSRRLVIVCDSTALGGHLNDLQAFSPISGAPINRLRAIYPGKISGLWTGITSILNWGNGSMAPFATYVYQYSLEGSPSTREYLLGPMGYGEWASSSMTAAVFATRYQAFVNALRILDPSVTIYVTPAIQTAKYANTNGNGETLQQFVDASNALTSVTHIDITGPLSVPQSSVNNAQPSVQLGQYNITQNVKTALGF